MNFGCFDQQAPVLLIRSDSSWDNESHHAVVTWVADIPLSEYQVSDSQVMKAPNALQVEAHVCRLGLLWATKNSFANVLVYTDSELLISLLNPNAARNISIHHALEDIRRLAVSIKGCRLMKVSRDEVAIAHDLARTSRNPSFPFLTH